jgi:hypothetical protein
MIPWTSTSLTRLYFLSGASEIRFLDRSGASASVTRIPVGANEQAGFAVSPDDKRIAVSIFSYSPPQSPAPLSASLQYTGMRLYVEDLQGAGHHIQIFTSSTLAEFPIGWSAGRLVLAVSIPLCCTGTPLNPYAATSYHLVNPDTAIRLVTLCERPGFGAPVGPIETFGVMCPDQNGEPTFLTWEGVKLPPTVVLPSPSLYQNAMSPNGKEFAIGSESVIVIVARAIGDHRIGEAGWVFAFLDDDTVVFKRTSANHLSTFHVPDGPATDLPDALNYLGKLPAAVT